MPTKSENLASSEMSLISYFALALLNGSYLCLEVMVPGNGLEIVFLFPVKASFFLGLIGGDMNRSFYPPLANTLADYLLYDGYSLDCYWLTLFSIFLVSSILESYLDLSIVSLSGIFLF